MRCEEVQEQLSEYLEKLLEPGQSKSVDGHLTSCPRCTGELAALAECRRLVGGLPLVEPPFGFTSRVMAHVRDSAERPSWWQRLFFPLQSKLPLQATAVLLVGVMSVYLLQKEKPQEKLMRPSAPQNEPKAAPQFDITPQGFSANDNRKANEIPKAVSDSTDKPSTQPASVPTKPQTVTTKETALAARPGLEAKEPASGSQANPKGRDQVTVAPKSTAEERANTIDSTALEGELPPTPSRPISGAIGVSQPAGGRSAPAAPSLDSIMSERAMRAPLPERARSNPLQPTHDIEIVIRRHPQRVSEQQRDNAEALRKDVERKPGAPNTNGLTAARAAPASTQAEPLFRTIPADQYEQFKKELAAQGTIVSEVRTGMRDNDGPALAHQTLTIKITVLP